MQAKKKICSGCNQPQLIWKNYMGSRFCKQCWTKHQDSPKPKVTVKQKTIPHRSSKRSKEEREYSVLRLEFLTKKTMCEAHLTNCSGLSTDVHHKQGRIGSLLLDTSKWLSVCRSCHDWIENNPKEAKEKGFSLSRNQNTNEL